MEKKMAKQKPTKKEIETVVSGIINHLRFIEEKVNAIDNLFGLYLKWKEDQEEFNKFIEEQMQEHNKQIDKKEPGESK
tara:strand:- start:2853 stop:3086 length:234 start_codon:yes stop_codon:yes gene_type:complete